MSENIDALNQEYGHLDPLPLLELFLKRYKGAITLASSLSPEDQVLTDMVMQVDPETMIFTLDTGRLFPETYELMERTNARYNTVIQVFFPERDAVEKMVNSKGINLFYESVENRKLCCHVRKVEPLQRAFNGMKVWICGLRKEQSVTRTHLRKIEWDEGNRMLKINPLIDWTGEEVWTYIRQQHVPYNPLNDRGFLSIGCQPCTRAVEPGEDERAGRWWWENPELKECGLHRRHHSTDTAH
ncbi:MAG TPA: phosphoadenylyl-sulfate reductase [Bacteroidales bacterium]|nr:phosphoadenylyl-sulfate reductase [Bacteroidales bacterium]HRZ48644.1 phosphoadenylyl-sulfate reductase [Bacteroidales bacterium]